MPHDASSLRCPVCSGPLAPVALACHGCQVRVEGEFRLNEFVGLSAEDLHFLRLFVHLEGRIRDMESALGVSYPTIKARIAALKRTLLDLSGAAVPPPPVHEASEEVASSADDDEGVQKILEQLEQGAITPAVAKELLRKRQESAQ